MIKRKVLFITFLAAVICIPLFLNYLKNQKIETFKNNNYLNLIDKTEVTLTTLIKEKQNTTTTIALGLANNEKLISSLEDPTNLKVDLKNYSLRLREKTEFKNVWFQLISKEGISLQRSWTDYKGDNISLVRADLQRLLKDPKTMNTISVGKFDMTFKSMIPIYDKSKKFLGIIEVITHFNSIARKLKKENVKTVILADKSYKKQIEKPFSKIFVKEYYVANLDADKSLLKYLSSIDIDKFILKIFKENYVVNEELNYLISYYRLDNINEKPMGHFLLFHSLDEIDIIKISEISTFYNLLIILSLVAIALIFYLTFSLNIKNYSEKQIKVKGLLLITISFFVIVAIIVPFLKEKADSDISKYNKEFINKTLLEYNSIINSNRDIAELIFSNEINTSYIKTLIKNRKRDELYKHFKKKYSYLKKRFNVRQIHFHLPDSTSFLRMHKPKKYGDSLKGIRESVDYVNSQKKSFFGFEEGRIYNGFRNVFPVFDKDEHLGSVEVSFDVYSFIDIYLKTFDAKRVNLLINKEIVEEKVFKSEQSNYIESPVKGFLFDKVVVQKLRKTNKPIAPKRKSKKVFEEVSKKIFEGKAFVAYFEQVNELVTVVPLFNKLNGKVIGSLNIANDAEYIKNRKIEFYEIIIVIIFSLLFIMIFIYREILSRAKLNNELKKNQIILDSQNSFIIITDGKNLKVTNNTLLEFFGYSSLKEFKKEHDCVCDFFEKQKGYLTKYMGKENWFEYILAGRKKNNLVKMTDKNAKTHIFYIEFNKNNKVTQNDYIVTFVDISNLKNMEEQLVQSEKMASLGSMLGNIAHQWRQPLSVISTAASGIKFQNEYSELSKDEIGDTMSAIILNTKYLSETIDTFRDFLKEKKLSYIENIQDSIDMTLKILEPVLINCHIELINKINYENPIYKKMSRGELSQVVTNIFNNAKDVFEERNIRNPRITIECTSNINDILISIEDNAGGISDDVIKNIFEPYFTTKHQSVGTGLGLYMSHRIVNESLGGSLYVKNTKEGAKFFIKLPLDSSK
jgi:sensor histidine kinase regulating citrate/malate metabolism